MVIFYYVNLMFPLIVMFAVGYFAVVLFIRLLKKQKLFRSFDALAQLAGALGLAAAFLLFGSFGLDRFAFASDQARITWMESGFYYEMMQSLFSGFVCALFAIAAGHGFSSSSRFRSMVVFVMVFLASFVSFGLWPTLVSLSF